VQISLGNDLKFYFDSLNSTFNSGKTLPIEFRLAALDNLERMIKENQEQICGALHTDLHKPKQEALVGEVAMTLEEIQLAKKNLRQWMAPLCRRSPLALFPSRNRVYFEPLGSVLIIGPWNYPFYLLMAPLVGAIAAGNCVLLKPSELALSTSKLVRDLIHQYFPQDFLQVIVGGIPETTALLDLPWDHIFFTGSTAVGKIVMQAAAKNLVPVTLELGGKSPTIVCEDADLDLTARRIVWGKFYNAGQTCVAPDYLYVHQSVAEILFEKIKAQIVMQFGLEPKESQSYARIINHRNVERLSALLAPHKIGYGGQVDSLNKYIAPTLLRDVDWEDAVMQEEIFGPILPILTFNNLENVFRTIRSKPKPLAAYFFSLSAEKQGAFVEQLSFGGGCINDTLVHLGNPHLPFGGVGASGQGRYHGHYSFLTFSHQKSVMTRYKYFDLMARYAPYSDKKLKLFYWLFDL
jgi:aldehyde dehydrogenase (NAD+)